MKTKDELNALKNEVETLNRKLQELSEEELNMVTGGLEPSGFYSSVNDIARVPGSNKNLWILKVGVEDPDGVE